MRIRIGTILEEHPFSANNASSDFNTINGDAWDSIGSFQMPFSYPVGWARYDGLVAKWIAPPSRYKVAYQFTIASFGHFGQVPIYGVPQTTSFHWPVLPGQTLDPQWWVDVDEPRTRFMRAGMGVAAFDTAFPVRI